MDFELLSFRAYIVAAVFGICVFMEHRYPLRSPIQAWLPRLLHNIALGFSGSFLLRLSLYPLVAILATHVEQQRWGILPLLPLSPLLSSLLALLLLDYTLYLWHMLCHRVPLLWRFHKVHHFDLDLDTSTALRFHFGELIGSSLYRSLQILVLGIDPITLALFELIVTSSAQFHHSNLRFPFAFEQRASRLFIMPRLHGIHHSQVSKETDSNFGAVLTLWDWLHKTLRRPQVEDAITIGLPPYTQPRYASFGPSLLAPFQSEPLPEAPSANIAS